MQTASDPLRWSHRSRHSGKSPAGMGWRSARLEVEFVGQPIPRVVLGVLCRIPLAVVAVWSPGVAASPEHRLSRPPDAQHKGVRGHAAHPNAAPVTQHQVSTLAARIGPDAPVWLPTILAGVVAMAEVRMDEAQLFVLPFAFRQAPKLEVDDGRASRSQPEIAQEGGQPRDGVAGQPRNLLPTFDDSVRLAEM